MITLVPIEWKVLLHFSDSADHIGSVEYDGREDDYVGRHHYGPSNGGFTTPDEAAAWVANYEARYLRDIEEMHR